MLYKPQKHSNTYYAIMAILIYLIFFFLIPFSLGYTLADRVLPKETPCITTLSYPRSSLLSILTPPLSITR